MKRREFLRNSGILGSGVLMAFGGLTFPAGLNAKVFDEKLSTEEIFNVLIKIIKDNNWSSLPIGQLIGKIGIELLDTPYRPYTLEGDGPEVCRINLKGMDCVTFFEFTLDAARIVKKGKYDFNDLYDEITYTRYRDGIIEDYSSRLHYTSEWIADNVAKGVVEDVTKSIGGEKWRNSVFYMSSNPNKYPPLKKDVTLISKITEAERKVNMKEKYYIPIDRIKSIESKILTGDIIAITCNVQGLDYSHTGIAYRDDEGILRLMHASSAKRKVLLDKQLSKYVIKNKINTGISVVRPLSIKSGSEK